MTADTALPYRRRYGVAARRESSPKVLNSSVIAPFGLAISGQDVWYTDGFVGTVNKISKGTDKVVTTGPQPEVAGIDVIQGVPPMPSRRPTTTTAPPR